MTANRLPAVTRTRGTQPPNVTQQAPAQRQATTRSKPVHHHVRPSRHGFRYRAIIAALTAFVCVCPMIGTTSPASAAALPDDRGYELVSPPDAQGVSTLALLDATSETLLRPFSAVARDGSAVLWRAATALPGDLNSAGLFDVYRSVRGSKAWETNYAGPPRLTGGAIPANPAFTSPNLDQTLWETFNASIDPSDHDPAESAGAAAPFRYQDEYRIGADGTYVHVNRGSIEVPAASEGPSFVGASEDLRKVMFVTDRQLEPDAPVGGTATYWTDGQSTKVVSKDETGAPLVGSIRNIGLSANGSIAVILSEDAKTLYVWSAQTGTTVKAVGPVFPSTPGGGDLGVEAISADGKQVLFFTAAPLTAGDTDTSRDLYQYNTSTGQITLVSAPSGGGGLGNSDACAAGLPNSGRCDVWPVVSSSDGSVVYFVSPEQLVSGQGVDGGVNLYRAAHGDIHYVATIDASDPVFQGGSAGPGFNAVTGPKTRHVRLSPDGSKLLFESRAPLTGYDNAGFLEVYVYDSSSGAVVCASCRPNGTPPTGDSTLYQISGLVGAKIGGDYQMTSANTDEHGDRIFFNSRDAITTEDVNGRNDVYQYTVASRTPALISTGRSPNDSAYLGNGVDGRDVFFYTTDSLVPQDRNGAVYKVYDARVDPFPPPPSEPSSCQGAACRNDEAAPPPGAQGSGRVAPRRPPSSVAPKVAASRVVVSGHDRSRAAARV